MVMAVTFEQAHARRIDNTSASGNGTRVWRNDYFMPGEFKQSLSKDERIALHERLLGEGKAVAHGFLVEQEPLKDIPAHFHRVSQFQVIVRGGGKLGKHDVGSVALHYTDPYTAYGPIQANAEGIWYFTLRGQYDPGANYLFEPESRKLIKPSKKRFMLVPPEKVAVGSGDALVRRHENVLETLIEAQDDGVVAHIMRLAPGSSMTAPDPSSGGGQYILVVKGALRHAGTHYSEISCLHVGPSEPAFLAQAGIGGAEALVLQFPRAIAQGQVH